MRIADQRRSSVRRAPDRPLPAHAKLALAAEILGAYLRVRWLMSRHEIRAIVARVRVSPAGRITAESGSLETRLVAIRLGGAVRRTLNVLPTDSRCLVQALVLSRLLSTRAIPSTLIIGARTQPEFDAHAWVEHQGQPVLSTQGFDELRLVEI